MIEVFAVSSSRVTLYHCNGTPVPVMANKPAPSLTDLAAVLAKLDDPESIERFLHDLLTPAEIQALTERWAIVRMLAAGMTQREVALALDVSVTTVTRGNRQLQHGAGGFTHAITLLAITQDPTSRKAQRGQRPAPQPVLPPKPVKL